MANPRWIGTAANIKQTHTITIALTWAAADTITLTIDNVTFVVTIGTLVTTAQVATTLKQAYNGETLTDTTASYNVFGGAIAMGAFAEMTASVSSSVVTLTANTAGKPFTMTTGDVATTAGDGTATVATAKVNAGAAEGDNVDNYDTNAVPTDADALYFDEGSADFLYDISFAAQMTTIYKAKKFTGKVGLAEVNRDSTKTYREYRGKYLVTDDNGGATTTAHLEYGEGQGSGRFKWDSGAGIAVLNIYGRGTRAETGVPCILWKGSAATNVVNNLAGDLGVGFFGAETATVATLRTGDGPASNASTICMAGVTLTTVLMNGGYLSTTSAITTGTQTAGRWEHNVGTITTLNVNGGRYQHLGGATITTLTVRSGGVFDASKGNATFVITNTVQLYEGCEFNDPFGRSGNVVLKINGDINKMKIVVQQNKTITFS